MKLVFFSLKAHLQYRALLFVAALFLALSSTGLAQVTLANFSSDQKQVMISLRTSTGEAIKLNTFSPGQISGSFSLDPRPTDFIFVHPTLGTNTFKLTPSTNSQSWLVYSVVRMVPPSPDKPPAQKLFVQKLSLGQNRAMGYRAFNVCTNPVSLLVDGKTVTVQPSSIENGSGFTELSPNRQITVAKFDGSEPVTSNPEDPIPVCFFIYPKDEKGGVAWSSLTE
jgi:hypothetical protein